jgi:hypothetical protein
VRDMQRAVVALAIAAAAISIAFAQSSTVD